MKFILYKTVDSDNVINKTLTNPLTVDIFLTAKTNIINPIIPISDIEGVNIFDYNYCQIPELNRYYFINSIENINAKIFSLECMCDVLMTYQNEILKSNARVMRSIKTGDYFNGESITNVKPSMTNYLSNVTLNSEPSLILSTVGGK